MNKPRWFIACGMAVVCLWVAPERGFAQEQKPCDQPRFAEDATGVFRRISDSAGKEAADIVVYCDEEHFALDNEGKKVHTSYMVFKVMTQRGAEGWDSLSQEWEPWHEARPALRARVIAGGKSAQWLDQKTINDAPASESEDKVYSDRRIVRAPLPAMEPGVVVEEEVIQRDTSVFFSAGIVEQTVLVRSGPIRESRLVIEAPSALPLKYVTKLLPKIRVERSENNQITKLQFEQDGLEEYGDAEELRPGNVPAYPTVTFATGNSWLEVARAYSAIVDRQLGGNELKALVAGLTKGKTSRQEKTEAIVQYLSREVRYTGVEFDEAAIVPHTPGETLKRKYGDCKDKAALMVAMLRAADIPANVALLNVAGWTDVDEDLPGLGIFDHAIVEVPGNPEYWIDATDEFARLGQLPADDQGRLALIAVGESEKLKRIPETASEDNRMVERREILLAENGPANVIETTEPHGVFESDYRSWYVDEVSKDVRKKLAVYVKDQYLADRLGKVEKGDARDLSKDFTLTLKAEKARRGYTELDNAGTAIRLEGLFRNLPKALREKEESGEKKDDGSEAKPKKERSTDYQLQRAFVSEWDYTIIPPAGFQLKALPETKRVALGPAILELKFATRADGAVEGTIRFDTVKRRFTVAEAKELRNRVVEISNGEALLVRFEPIAVALLNEGKTRESILAWKELIARHPSEAVHHLQYAKTLLAAGLGETARSEARTAVKLEPNSPLAQKTLADILQYDLVGRKFKPGSDYAGAEAAFRAAKKLEPDNASITGNLAILLEYNAEGERYGTGAKLKESVAEYKSLKEEELADIGLKNNLGFTLFYAGQFAEAKEYAEKLNPTPNNLIVAAVAGTNGSAAGIAEAKKRLSNEEDLKSVLASAGDMLMRARRYQEAADLVEAGANGNNASNKIALAGFLRKATKHEEMKFENSPVGLMKEYFVRLGSDRLTREWSTRLASKNAQKVMDRYSADELADQETAGKKMRRGISQSGFPADVMVDILLQAAEMNSEGDDTVGYRVNWPMGRTMKMFVVRENGKYKILDSNVNMNSIGLEILDREKGGDLKGARALLDWARDEQHVEGGDDALAGKAFPRMWTKGKEGGPEEIRKAAAAILCQTKHTARDGIEILEAELAKATNETDKLNISLALLEGYGAAEEMKKSYDVATDLAKAYPDSKRMFLEREFGLRALRDFAEADVLNNEYLQKNIADLQGMRALQYTAEAQEDYERARARVQAVLKSGKGEARDYNQAAWYSLFTGKVGAEDLGNAVKAAQMSQHSANTLHTLGCVYAEQGKTKEAREVLVQAMDQLNLAEPTGEYWYAFGRIAEQFGEKEIAAANYRKVRKPSEARNLPASTYVLAQKRLKLMPADGGKAATSR
jgi:Flp pilus assembly protein TadD